MINDYRLVKKLGEGATAEVWEATRETDQTKCALKIFSTARNPEYMIEMARNEFNTVS